MSSSRTSSLSEARKSSDLVLHVNKIGSKRNRARHQLGMAYALVEDNMEGANLIDKVVWNDESTTVEKSFTSMRYAKRSFKCNNQNKEFRDHDLIKTH